MHEAREAAAQLAWRLYQERTQEGLGCFREIIRAIEPILAEGWRRQMESDAIVNPDLSDWDGAIEESTSSTGDESKPIDGLGLAGETWIDLPE